MKHYSFKAEAGHFKNKTIPDHMAFLIGGIKEFKGWVKPDGYISHEEREINDLRAAIEHKKKLSDEKEKLKKELAFEDWYGGYLDNPESEESRSVLDKMNTFEQQRFTKKEDKKSVLFDAWVRVKGC